MDATTKERADRSDATPLNLAQLSPPDLPRAEIMANVAEGAVRAGIGYRPGGRDVSGVDGFGFLRLCVDFATPQDLGDLYGYSGWPDAEPNGTRIANLIEDWGMVAVGDHRFKDLRRGDVLAFVLDHNRPGPTAEIVVAAATPDRGALVAACWKPDPPRIQPYQSRYDGRIMVRVYRWPAEA